MCLNPIVIKPAGFFYAGSEPVTAPCRQCWQCLKDKVDNWTGRNLAEAHTATASYAVTFTYGRSWDGYADHIRASQLLYSDTQKLLKRMRKAEYKVRYIIAGEYGAALGRAHWHGVFHFYGDKLPDWEQEYLTWSQEKWDRVGGVHIPEWSIYGDPIGFVHIKRATYAHTRYALKYMLKDQYDPDKQVVFSMSRKPPLGFTYFVERARETAEAGLPLQDMAYHFDVRTMSGEEKRMRFALSGRMAEIYVTSYISYWQQYQKKPLPDTQPVTMWQQWGRLGNEDMAQAKRNEEQPVRAGDYPEEYGKTDSILDRDGRSSVERQLEEGKGTYFGWLRWKDHHAMNDKKRKQREEKERGKAQSVDGQAQRLIDCYRGDVDAARKAGLTYLQFTRLPQRWQQFGRKHPAYLKSLFEAARRDWENGPKHGKRHLW